MISLIYMHLMIFPSVSSTGKIGLMEDDANLVCNTNSRGKMCDRTGSIYKTASVYFMKRNYIMV